MGTLIGCFSDELIKISAQKAAALGSTVAGAAMGAIPGAFTGASLDKKNRLRGALIGGGLGAVGGGVIGHHFPNTKFDPLMLY